jgi:hypothetical protein
MLVVPCNRVTQLGSQLFEIGDLHGVQCNHGSSITSESDNISSRWPGIELGQVEVFIASMPDLPASQIGMVWNK